MYYSIIGAILTSVGTIIAGFVPIHKAFSLLRGFGGGTDDKWKKINKEINFYVYLGISLSIFGAFLQIIPIIK